MLRLLLLYLTLGWVCVLGVTEEDQDVQESLAPQGWASSWSRSNSPLERPRRRQDQTLPYASWESPLLVKESLTSEEKSWLPQKDPLEIIKEGYTSGSRMFDYNFEQSPALVLKTVGDYNVGAAALSHAGAPHRPSLGDNLSRNFNSSPQPGRPRKYYLTGVMQELPRDSGYANKHLRKYFLQADTKAMTANKDQPRVVFSDVEDSIHLIQLNQPQHLNLLQH
ncbi:uncharacterized protein [Cherax quadricarinatus]|uniref:uncharacterized protein n=1 Tax=Cherax quadricarinatus TaxID=27406 RepID=UPI00387E5A49